ncbi:phenylalanine--tRNA ligase subunit beta [Sinimarinibacterium sp. CAU 1509]|uniref:phenylalanine--tRNA ligase subunit beta n=1 Tax=Sinimarinibacterium sp. CAU 1509 TaxID=2562283 RepID=UPI0010AD3986|nr:phenylalanine--tRNA ligase subunit beta [Sinimarinibacterium sp. CAU 1509]TJY56738.1 phenylalanine--tRNA ligase subunit beta [Sinimarinibacterium sp. CAU 1509]
MKLSENWLREWASPNATIHEIADRLIMGGLELEIEPAIDTLPEGVVVGCIVSTEKHPQADRLQVCGVDVGTGETLQIVCGAPNARPGIKVPCARVGARLPGGLEITQAKLRGVDSAGMLCSAKELSLSDKSDGLLELDLNAKPGQPITDYLNLQDNVLNLEITPNRGDCLSVLGLARDVAALFDVNLKRPNLPAAVVVGDQRLRVEVEDVETCPTYSGRIISKIKTTARTPDWMRERLRRSGLRCINPVVDTTNYVMLELGQPLHAFDRDKLRGSISVRRARAGEQITVLTGEALTLNHGELLITDDSGPIALAGVMGGMDSGVTEVTTTIFLESACFAPTAITGTARRHKLTSDAAYRYERGVDPALHRTAIDRASQLIADICGGEVHPIAQAGRTQPDPISIRLRHSRLNELLGHEIPAKTVEALLARLNIVTRNEVGGVWLARIPSYRYDLRIEVDLIEEVARLYGYDDIPARPYAAALAPSRPPEARRTLDNARATLCARGWQETISLAFVDPSMQTLLAPDTASVKLDNPIAENLSAMRTTLWPGLIQSWLHNRQRQIGRMRLFETGVCFADQNGTVHETSRISGLAVGTAVPEQWGAPERPVDFYDVKAELTALFAPDDAEFRFEAASNPALHPGRCARILRGEQVVGWLGELHPRVVQQLDVPQVPVLFEIDWAAVATTRVPVAQALSEFPSSRRDLAVVVDEAITADQLLDCVRAAGGALLRRAFVFDIYRGEAVGNACKSVALGLIFNDYSRTLTVEDIDAATADVVESLTQQLRAVIRQ